ncbi:protein of unknown function [Nitrospina watsonii]|uniref:Uncharacterized protein n=1 Tax=Nitrospina watsonii TaxID=1323948 RepID=A0ABM9HD56_9BACT|nr:protein of unknown function [Nitrospina watsonii]
MLHGFPDSGIMLFGYEIQGNWEHMVTKSVIYFYIFVLFDLLNCIGMPPRGGSPQGVAAPAGR